MAHSHSDTHANTKGGSIPLLAMLVIITFLSVVVPATAEGEHSDVVTLQSTNFSQTILDKGVWMVDFHAPWCGHCKKLAPIWEEAATKLKGKVQLAKVDVTDESNSLLSEGYGIKLLPTIKLFMGGEMVDFSGERTLESITSFAEKNLENFIEAEKNKRPSEVIHLDASNFQSRITQGGDWLVCFYANWCKWSSRLSPEYEKVAWSLHGKVNVAKVDVSAEEGIAKLFNITPWGDHIIPTVMFYKDAQFRVLRVAVDEETITDFVNSGWKEAEETFPFPPSPPTLFEQAVADALEMIDTFTREHVWVVMFSVFVYGVFIGTLVSSQPAPQSGTAPARKSAPSKGVVPNAKGAKGQNPIEKKKSGKGVTKKN